MYYIYNININNIYYWNYTINQDIYLKHKFLLQRKRHPNYKLQEAYRCFKHNFNFEYVTSIENIYLAEFFVKSKRGGFNYTHSKRKLLNYLWEDYSYLFNSKIEIKQWEDSKLVFIDKGIEMKHISFVPYLYFVKSNGELQQCVNGP